MAEASKSAKDPVLEQKFLSFLRERISLHEPLSIKNLTGHLSALSPRVRNHFGASRSCLKQFLTEHPKDFYVDKKDNVRLASKDSSSTSKVSAIEHVPETPSQNHTSSSNSDKQVSPPKDQMQDLPKELNEVRGKVYRLFPAYGFISVSNPIQCSVYFNVNCFENGRVKGKDGGMDIAIGEGVYLNAKKGPDNVEAQYRATKVWRVDPPTGMNVSESSSTRNGLSSPPASLSCSSKGSFSNASAKKEIYGTGRIDNMFMKFGFISQNNTMKDNVFFHVKTVHKPGVKKITNLMDVLKLGDTVNFSAIPTEQKNAQVRWQATRVWMPNDEGPDGTDIYYSSPEASISSGSVESLPLACTFTPQVTEKKLDHKHSTNHLNCVESKFESSSDHIDVNHHPKAAQMSNSSSSVSNPSLPYQIGTIWPHSEQMGSILFGSNQKALVLIDVFYQCEERIDNFMWEVEDGQRIQFEAVEDPTWAPEYPWKATLAWVGRKPDVAVMNMSQLKDAYSRVCGEPVDSSDDWMEPEDAANEVDDDEDEDFVEENIEDDVMNDNEHFANNDFNENPAHSDSSGTEGNDFEDDGFEENMENVPSDSITVILPEKTVDARSHREEIHIPLCTNSPVSERPTHPFPKAQPFSNRGQLTEVFSSVPTTSASWAEITEDDDMAPEAMSVDTKSLPTERPTKLLSGSSCPPMSSTDVLHPKETEPIQVSEVSTSVLEKRVEELTLMVQELLKRVPAPQSLCDSSTQTGAFSLQDCSPLPRRSTANQDTQTVSTGPLMYTELYYSQ